jgi:hypothetical protein
VGAKFNKKKKDISKINNSWKLFSLSSTNDIEIIMVHDEKNEKVVELSKD